MEMMEKRQLENMPLGEWENVAGIAVKRLDVNAYRVGALRQQFGLHSLYQWLAENGTHTNRPNERRAV